MIGDILIGLGVAGLLWSGFYAIEHFAELNACELEEDVDHVAEELERQLEEKRK